VKQPRRLLAEQSRLPTRLAHALRGAPGEPSSQQLERLASNLSGALGVSLGPLAVARSLQLASKGALSGTTTAGVVAAKPLAVLGAWVVGGLALGAGLSGAAYTFAVADGPAPRAVLTKAPGEASSAPAPKIALTAQPAAELPSGVDLPARSPIAAANPHSAAMPSAGPAPKLESELSLLKRAQAQIATTPAEALVLTELHALRFPAGALEQEREVIAIDALVRLGRSAEAAQRAARFQVQYPGSAHARRLTAQFEAKSP
jgi:hypothetical protein